MERLVPVVVLIASQRCQKSEPEDEPEPVLRRCRAMYFSPLHVSRRLNCHAEPNMLWSLALEDGYVSSNQESPVNNGLHPAAGFNASHKIIILEKTSNLGSEQKATDQIHQTPIRHLEEEVKWDIKFQELNNHIAHMA